MPFKPLLIALIAIAAVALPGRANAEGDERARLSGTFAFAGVEGEDGVRRAAIDRAIGGLFFAIRGIARSRLTNATKIQPWVSFAFDGGKIKVGLPSAPEASSPEDGASVDYVSGSDRTKLSQRIVGGQVTQLFVAEQGRRLNQFVLAPDGNTLVLKVTVSSPKLSAPVVYSLTYKKSR